MALYAWGEFQNPITSVPHRLLFDGWKSRLTVPELQAIDAELNHLVNMQAGCEIRTARWLTCDLSPFGHHDWGNSAFKRIRDKACEGDRTRTCWCFAVFLWEHMMNRPDPWHVKVLPLDDVPLAASKFYRWP